MEETFRRPSSWGLQGRFIIWPHLEVERASPRSALEFKTLLTWRDVCYWETCRFAHACILDHDVCKADVARGDTHIVL
jgi:hypothetical protein